MRRRVSDKRDSLTVIGLILAALALYTATLLPGIGIGDTAELQRVAPTLGLAHATGYPLYTILGWIWSRLVPFGSMAWRMNLFSAFAAALALGAIFAAGRAIGQRRAVAAVAALALGVSATFWREATHAEIYAFALLLQAMLLLALLQWRADRLPFWMIGLVVGLGLAHHRTIVLLLPGTALFMLLSGRRPSWRDALLALLALLALQLLYLYVPLRAEPWQDRWALLVDYASGSAAERWLDLERLQDEPIDRLLGLLRDLVLPQLTPAGALLALLGAGRLARRDRAAAALLSTGYITVFAFACAYYVVDVDVFLLPAHLIETLLMAEGATALAGAASSAMRLSWRPALVTAALAVIPAILLMNNIDSVRANNTAAPEQRARRLMSQQLEPGALLAGEGYELETLRYLQAVEGMHPELSFSFEVDRRRIDESLEQGRAVYLLRPAPELGLRQDPEGLVWRVSKRPLEATTPKHIRWSDGIALTAYTLHRGPYRAGDVVPITLAWAAETRPGKAYTTFIHLVGPDGQIYGQQDRQPSTAPTNQWEAGKPYIDLYGPALAANAPPGIYQVLLGWYEYPSLQRLGVQSGGDSITLGEISVDTPQ